MNNQTTISITGEEYDQGRVNTPFKEVSPMEIMLPLPWSSPGNTVLVIHSLSSLHVIPDARGVLVGVDQQSGSIENFGVFISLGWEAKGLLPYLGPSPLAVFLYCFKVTLSSAWTSQKLLVPLGPNLQSSLRYRVLPLPCVLVMDFTLESVRSVTL